MNGLADIAINYFCAFLFPGDPSNIDSDFAGIHIQSFPEFTAGLSPEERVALSAAAKRALDFMLQPPDEYGYTPGSLVSDEESDEEKEFLQLLASGELYDQWCK